jgi:hypothetical protein
LSARNIVWKVYTRHVLTRCPANWRFRYGTICYIFGVAKAGPNFTLREEHRQRVFENRVLRRIFGPKRDEVAGEWRKLHIGELHNSYSSPDIIRQIKLRRME